MACRSRAKARTIPAAALKELLKIMTKDFSILYPVLVQALILFATLFLMAFERFKAINAKQVRAGEAGERPTFLGRAGTVSNAYHNQLEMPMMFYAVVAFALITDCADWEMTALAWVYVALRAVQTFIHVTYNKIGHRAAAFVGSAIVLMAMWINLAIWLILGW